jgi:hypothetical protein
MERPGRREGSAQPAPEPHQDPTAHEGVTPAKVGRTPGHDRFLLLKKIDERV